MPSWTKLQRAMQVFENAILNYNLACKERRLENGTWKIYVLIGDDVEIWSGAN